MKTRFFIIVAALLTLVVRFAAATQADDTTITITAQNPGPTVFISQLTLTASSTDTIKSIQFTISTKAGAFARPLSGTYSLDYMVTKGYLTPPSTDIFLPVYGLYAGATNTVTLTYNFLDGSSKTDSTTIDAGTFDDQGCGYNTPTVLKARTDEPISYDYIFIRSGCGTYSPVIVDSDGNLRWVSPLAVPNALTGSSTFYQGAIYAGVTSILYRIDLDGTVTVLNDYSTTDDVLNFHHNIDAGKAGLLAAVDTTSQFESTILDVDLTGTVVKTFNMADIISAAMTAGGDDPSQFVYPSPTDWFHNNAATYNRADDSIIVSSRENFVICIDYASSTIKWILGDQTKKWFTFPSLAAFALNVTTDSLPPIGQHATSLTYDNDLLLFDDGFGSMFQQPPGETRTYSSPRKYELNLDTASGMTNPGTATVVYQYEQNQSVYSPICSSVYEDAPNNYLVDYAAIGFPETTSDLGQLLGLNSAGDQVFYYQYPTMVCNTAYNSQPIHLENTQFPVVGPQALNVSTRGQVSNTDDTLIAGFIVTGTGSKSVAVRLLGPSLGDQGLSGTVTDPLLTIHDSSGAVVATNDNWQSDPSADQLTADGLAPTNTSEAATIQSLAPGYYTVVASSVDGTAGIGLVEVYDLSPGSGSVLANLSTRGFVGNSDQALISGFIEGQESNGTIIVRGLGPSLGSAGLTGFLTNPLLTVYDSTGTAIATNDDWGSGTNTPDLVSNGLAPADDSESALVLHPPAGNYTAIVTGADGGTGLSLVEIYDLDQSASPQ
ncbi:MAG TPA: aryl-sulfate sulfotransferase [Chthoniobacterales bacterium]|jgi:hypothetical protein